MENNNWEILTIGLMIAVLFIVSFNAYEMYKFTKINIGQGNNNVIINNMNDDTNDIMSTNNNTIAMDGPDVMPKGIPDIYGIELGVSFDDISSNNPKKADETIKKIGLLDQQITLKGSDKDRYIEVAGKISCEYCCGTESIIFKNGEAACGCQHSFAMRGLAKYLIKNHGTEFTDDQILEELGKLKTLFFPQAITQKAKILQQKGIELNYINLASNKYRGIENQG